nr:RecQ family zinc-binding domain-containing protein [Bacillus sp. FJAT-49711]
MLSETQLRFLQYYYSSSIDADRVKSIKQDRYSIKYKKLRQMLSWVHSNECRRNHAMNYFNEKLLQNPLNCCDICRINLSEFHETTQIEQKTLYPSWKKRLQQLLLLESGSS